ncbi:MAG: GH39 family glycosyl hydrolase [bacterium]
MMKKYFLFALLPFIFSCTNKVKDKSELISIDHKKTTEIESNAFGIQFNPMPFHTNSEYDSLDVPKLLNELPVLIERTEKLGAKWARLSVDWSNIEDNDGNMHWEILDKAIAGLNDIDVEVYLCLHGGHREHTEFRPPVTEKELAAWDHWVEQMVRRYHEDITYWEIWNEGNSIWFWNDDPDAEEYFQLVKTSVETIKANDDNVKIVGGNLARLDLPFAQQLFDLGIAKYIDVFTFHPYSAFPEAIVKKIQAQVATPIWYERLDHPVQGLKDLIKNSGEEIALWQGECGYPSAMNSKGWNGSGPWNHKTQSKWIIRRALTDLSFDAGVSTYFCLKEYGSKDRYNAKGLIERVNLEEKPAFEVYQNVISTLNGEIETIDFDLGYKIKEVGSFYGVKNKNIFGTALINDAGETFYAYWIPTRMQETIDEAVVDVILHGRKLDAPVLLDLLNGHYSEIENIEYVEGNTILKNMPLKDYPMIIRVSP